MTVRGGDITQLILWDRIFEVKKDANVTFRLAGRVNETEPTGAGGIHTKQSVKLGGFDSAPVSIDPEKKDLEYLQGKYNDGEPGNCSMTLINGITYAGELVPEGELDANTGDGQTEVSALGAVFEQV